MLHLKPCAGCWQLRFHLFRFLAGHSALGLLEGVPAARSFPLAEAQFACAGGGGRTLDRWISSSESDTSQLSPDPWTSSESDDSETGLDNLDFASEYKCTVRVLVGLLGPHVHDIAVVR